MKTLIQWTTHVLCLAGTAWMLQAADEPTSSTPPKPKRDTIPFSGKVAAVDVNGHTLTLHGKERQRVLQITPQTKIKKDGKVATLAEAQINEEVGGQYRKEEDGKLTATSIRLGPKPEAESKQQEKPKRQKK